MALEIAGLPYRLINRTVNADDTLTMLQNGEADISLLGFRMSVSRMRKVAFTLPMDHNSVGFIAQEISAFAFVHGVCFGVWCVLHVVCISDETRSEDFIFHVYQFNVYASIIGVTVLVSLLLLLISRDSLPHYPRILFQCFVTYLRQHEVTKYGRSYPWSLLVSLLSCKKDILIDRSHGLFVVRILRRCCLRKFPPKLPDKSSKDRHGVSDLSRGGGSR